jgi:DNA-binding NarL/FixJ family response regulator
MPGEQRRPEASSTGKVIYIIGPGGLPNEAIASCLKRETGYDCFLLEDINHLHEQGLEDQSRPRLVLVDSQGKNPAMVLAELKTYLSEKHVDNNVVLFNMQRDLAIEKKCVLKGISGFFYKRDPLDIFLKGVRAVLEGELWISRKTMTQCILESTRGKRDSQGGSPVLTLRQSEILALVAIGATNEEIADKLCISPHTVKTHLYNIFKKISVPNRIQAALWATKHL